MHPVRLALLSAFSLPLIVVSCGEPKDTKPQAQAEAPKPADPATPSKRMMDASPEERMAYMKKVFARVESEDKKSGNPSQYTVTDPVAGLGDFGSSEPMERADMPTRGIIALPIVQETHFAPAAHWEQFNFPFKTKRWGRYAVRLTYQLKTSAVGVQLKFGEDRLKKQLTNTNGTEKRVMLGEIYVPAAGEQFMALYTPQSMGYVHFYPKCIELVPASEGEEVKQAGDGSVALLAKDATTWSEDMRYEPKPEKNCLGYWTDAEDFAEWEFTVEKPGKFAVAVHQGCGGGGGSEVAVSLEGQELKFKVQDTGGFQKWSEVNVGELKIEKPGTYHLTVKPQNKQGKAVMDVQKIVLAPVS
jgi:hypothetical protein